jgi:hypothetical protein
LSISRSLWSISNPTQPRLLTPFGPTFPYAVEVFFSGAVGFFPTD